MDIFETRLETLRAFVSGLLVDEVDEIDTPREKLNSTRCMLSQVKDEFGFKLKTRYKDGKLFVKRTV